MSTMTRTLVTTTLCPHNLLLSQASFVGFVVLELALVQAFICLFPLSESFY